MYGKLVNVDQLGFDEVFSVEGNWNHLTEEDLKLLLKGVSSVSVHMDLENAVLALLVETPISPLFVSTSKNLALSSSNLLSSIGKARYEHRFSLSTSDTQPETKENTSYSSGIGMHYSASEAENTPLTITERLNKQRLDNHTQAEGNWANILAKKKEDSNTVPDIPDYGMLCIWPEYPIDIGLSFDWADEIFGHTGILMIAGNTSKGISTGSVRYFDFGRYPASGVPSSEFSYLGAIRKKFNTKLASRTVEFDDSQKPTEKTIRPIIALITQLAGKNTVFNGFLKAAKVPNAFAKMVEYAELRFDIHKDVQNSFFKKL